MLILANAIEALDVDKNLIRKSFGRAAGHYDEAAVLQREVGGRLLERLDYVRIAPEIVLDIGCGAGITAIPLLRRYRKARVIGLGIAADLWVIARKRASWVRKPWPVCGDPEGLPLANASCDLIVSNLVLQWFDMARAFQEFQRVLRPGGLLMFSTLGPDTLTELSQSWAAADDYSHVNTFVDMHDLGDALIGARLSDPVVDAERITLTYRQVDDLMRDLKAVGAHNITSGRRRALTGKGRVAVMRKTYEQFRRQGLLPATFEIVYGHAWAPRLSTKRQDGVSVFPLSRLKRRK